jgi:hypothetical protein
MEEKENKLIIEANKKTEKNKKIEINLDYINKDYFRSLIGGFYRKGFNEIKINYSNRLDLESIQQTLIGLYGFEIYEIDNEYCIIKKLYDDEKIDLKRQFNKMLLIVKQINKAILNDIENKTFNSKDELYIYRTNTLRQRDLIMRTIRSKKIYDDNQFIYYDLSANIWLIVRNYCRLYKELNKDLNLSKIQIKFLEDVYKLFISIFFEKNYLTNYKKNFETYKKLSNEFSNFLNQSNKSNIIIYYANNILILIQACFSSQLLLKK